MRRDRSRPAILLAAALLLAALHPAPAAAQSGPSAADAARTFLQFHFASDHGFTKRSVDERRQWLDPSLYDLLKRELVRAEEFSRQNPDETPYFTGDPFTDSQSFPTGYEVGYVAAGGAAARVPVTFTWNERSERGRDRRAVTFAMVHREGRWLLRDVVDSSGESLRAVLSRAKYQ